MTAVCNGLKGVSTVYGDNKFEIQDELINDATPTIYINSKNRTVTYVVKDAMDRALSVDGQIIQIRDERISFIGLIDNVPALFSLYIPEGVLYTTEHARMPPLLNPAHSPKAKLFYSKCEINLED